MDNESDNVNSITITFIYSSVVGGKFHIKSEEK